MNGKINHDYTSWLATVQDIFQQLVLTVAWMHENGVCHLDLSLENTMVCNEMPKNENKHENKNNADDEKDNNDNNNENKNDNNNDDKKRVIVKIIDCGTAKYFGEEDLSKHNKTYNDKKRQTFSTYSKTIRDLNDIIVNNNNSKNGKNKKIAMSSELEKEYKKIRGDLRLAHPTFKNFQEYFKKNNGDSIFSCNRFGIGKNCYMAPEVMYKVSDAGEFIEIGHGDGYARAESNADKYDARKADIWSLGIMLFIMCNCSHLYQYPNPDNHGFKNAFGGNLRSNRMPQNIVDLLNKIFKPAANRITMDEMLQHPFLDLNLNLT